MPLVTLPLTRWFTAGTSRAGHDVYRGVSFHPRKLRSTTRSQTSREYFSCLPPPPPLTPPIVYFSLPLASFASFPRYFPTKRRRISFGCDAASSLPRNLPRKTCGMTPRMTLDNATEVSKEEVPPPPPAATAPIR